MTYVIKWYKTLNKKQDPKFGKNPLPPTWEQEIKKGESYE
jgi:hypothetical protein